MSATLCEMLGGPGDGGYVAMQGDMRHFVIVCHDQPLDEPERGHVYTRDHPYALVYKGVKRLPLTEPLEQ